MILFVGQIWFRFPQVQVTKRGEGDTMWTRELDDDEEAVILELALCLVTRFINVNNIRDDSRLTLCCYAAMLPMRSTAFHSSTLP